ncbi:AraC family transcriptional activator of pobA [Chitinophaga sp. W3I9]
MARNAILLHQEQLAPAGVEIELMKSLDQTVQIPHRDDHYMFIIQLKGRFLWELDFTEVIMKGPSISFVAPGQVHRYISYKNCEGWLVFVDNGQISTQIRGIFDTYLNARQSVAVQKEDAVFKIMPLFEDLLHQPSLPLQKNLISSLTATLAGMIASKIIQSQNTLSLVGGQKYNTVLRFKQLVNTKCKELKQVKAYASLLNITPLYLNEIVKEVTGFAASHWIHQEILLEAKRLLFYSSLDIKQVAYELGYEDHAYFSRFFKKNTGMTATGFRIKNH